MTMANLNYNSVTLAGRLCGDPEVKTNAAGTNVVNANLAVNRPYRQGKDQETDFFRLVAFGKTAEFLAQYFRKGSAILIDGRIQNNNYVDQQGVKHYSTDILVFQAHFVESRAEAAPAREPTQSEIRQASAAAQQAYVPTAYTDAAPGIADLAAGDELPF